MQNIDTLAVNLQFIYLTLEESSIMHILSLLSLI